MGRWCCDSCGRNTSGTNWGDAYTHAEEGTSRVEEAAEVELGGYLAVEQVTSWWLCNTPLLYVYITEDCV